jgi:hypothetical protein
MLYRDSAFREEFSNWIDYCLGNKKHHATLHGFDLQLKDFARMGPARAVQAIRHTIKNGWVGLREPTASSSNPKPTKHQPTCT